MRYYFLGIGGIGMSALARYFKQCGHDVSGYDRTESPLTKQLESEGIPVHYDDDPSLLPTDIDLVVFTPAIPEDTQEYVTLRQRGVAMKKRAQVLGELTMGKKCIAVAGTHGKTTTSSMIAHILTETEIGCTAFLGGVAKNYDSNLLVNDKSDYVVVEADEYDRSFLYLHPFFSVITATDPDHLDVYGTHKSMVDAFSSFANQTNPDGMLFLKEGLTGHGHGHEHEHEHGHSHETGDNDEEHPHLLVGEEISTRSYSARSLEADYYAVNVRNYNGNIFFDLRTPDKVMYDMQLTNSCLYNVENAVAAAAVALACGVEEYQLRHALKTFAGIKRRFDYRIKEKDLVYIDDYAHHPREIAATIESVRYLFPDKRVVGVFQPHLYSRTRDLAQEFADALSSLDEIVLLPVYPAREKPIPGVSTHLIMHKIKTMNRYLVSKEQMPDVVVALCPDVVLTMGAGDIDRLVPDLEKTLRENCL